MTVRLRQCCCGCSLKEGTVVIGIWFILGAVGATLGCIYFITWYFISYSNKSKLGFVYPKVVLPGAFTMLVCSLAQLITSSLLLRGVIKLFAQYDRRMVLPWLVFNGLLCGLLFLTVVGGAIACFIVTASQINGDLTEAMLGFLILMPGAASVGVYIYFLLIAYSFYSILPLLSSDRISILLERFKNPDMHSDVNSRSADNWPTISRTNSTFVGY